MKTRVYTKSMALVVGIAGLLILDIGYVSAEPTSENTPRLKQALERFPAADANADGILTMSEGRAFLAKQKNKNRARQGSRDTAKGPAPTYRNVSYGPHEQNVLDFWKAESDKPTPLVVFIHGGGFVGGDKSKARPASITKCLEAKVSFAAINYRFRTHAPIQDILRDAGRAIQFLRHKADEWNIDKMRIAAHGGSAGAGTSLWLAFHDDLADPASSDPVLRESSRLTVAASNSGQFSYDIVQWGEVFDVDPGQFHKSLYEFYHFDGPEQLNSPEGERIRADVDMRGLITPDDPPVYLSCSNADVEPTTRGILNHHPRHATLIKERCDQVGVEAVVNLPKVMPNAQPVDMLAFFFKHLGVSRPKKKANVQD